MPEPTIRGYRPGDEVGILDLFHRRFHPDRTLAHWRWKFRDHPWGPGLVSVAVDDADTVIAHSGGYPALLVAAESEDSTDPDPWPVGCLQLGDVMADRRALRRGLTGSLFERTLKHLHVQVCDAGMLFTYGVVAGKIDNFYARIMDRGVVGPVTLRRHEPRILETALSAVATDGAALAVTRVREPTPEFDDLLRRSMSRYGVLLRRDAEYVAWRYLRCPDGVHRVYSAWEGERLVGWSAFRRAGDRLLWGDALVDPDRTEAAAAILRTAIRDLGGDVLEAWFPRHPDWWDALLNDLGFETLHEPRGLCLIYICAGSVALEPASTVDRLYYSMGDLDLF